MDIDKCVDDEGNIALNVQKVIIHKEQVEVVINLLNLSGENVKSHTHLLNECGLDDGGEVSRTPVRNRIQKIFSGFSPYFTAFSAFPATLRPWTGLTLW